MVDAEHCGENNELDATTMPSGAAATVAAATEAMMTMQLP